MGLRSLLAPTVLAALLAAACAGGAEDLDQPSSEGAASSSAAAEEPLSPEQFTAQADEICITSAKSFVKNDARYTKNTTRKQSIAIEAEGVVLVRERLEALQELTPPEDLQSEWDDYMQLRAEAVRSYEALNAAFNDNNKKAQKKANARLNSDLEEINATGEAMGLVACANKLPAAEIKEVKSVLTTYFTRLDSCQRLTTKALIESIGRGQCASGLVASKKVKVRDVQGVEGVRANAVAVPDAYDGRGIAVSMLYEGGTYKVHGYEAE